MKYRNTSEIYIHDFLSIEPNCLWTRTEDIMQLVDEDEFITHPYCPSLFTPA